MSIQRLIDFRGVLNEEAIDHLLQDLEARLRNTGLDPKTKKRTYYIAVECLQNVYRHAPFNHKDAPSEFVVICNDDSCTVITANYILKSEETPLREMLDDIINSDSDPDSYRKKLSVSELSEKGGAGLGFAEIKRKSSSMEYSIQPAANEHSYFSLKVII